MNKKGFTLIEIILGLAIIGLISMAMLTVVSNNFSFLNRSRDMSQETFLSQQDIELEISQLKDTLEEEDHGLSLATVNIDGVQVDYHHVEKVYNNHSFQYVVTPEQLPEYLLLKTFDVKANLKTDTYDAFAIYPIESSSVEGTNNHDVSTYSSHWMRDVRQWYVSNSGFNVPVPRGDGSDPDFNYYNYLVDEGLESELGMVYPIFPDDYKLLGTETDELLEDIESYAGKHIVYQVTPAAKSGKLGITEVSQPVYISGLNIVEGLTVHLDASYIDISDPNDVNHDAKVNQWKDLSSGIEVATDLEKALSTDTIRRPSINKTDPLIDFSGQYVTYSSSADSVLINQNTSGKHIYAYSVVRATEGSKVFVNGNKTLSRTSMDENLVNDWYLVKDVYQSNSNTFTIGESTIDLSELLIFSFDNSLSSSAEDDLYESVSKYLKNKFSLKEEIGEIEEIYPLSHELYVGDSYAPPLSALARMSTGDDRYISITWNDDSTIDTSSPATIIRNGYASSTPDKTVQLTVNVREYAIEIVEAKFLSQSIIEVEFNENITQNYDKTKVLIDGVEDKVIYMEDVVGESNKLLAFIDPGSLDFSDETDSEISFETGSVEHHSRGEVLISNGQNYSLIGTSGMVFNDDFEVYDGWNDYDSGSVIESTDPQNTTNTVIEKINNNDPDGGYKTIGSSLGRNFIFEGWIYRPLLYSGGAQDRLAISDVRANQKSSDGYGFGVSGSNIYIEKRSGSSTQTISSNVPFARTNNQWYKFIYKSNPNNTLTLYILNEEDDEIKVYKVTSNSDNSFDEFDAVVIHGGHNFFVDQIKIFTY